MSGKSADAYRTISEAGEEAGLPAHVLRFWESKFTQIKPVKRAGGRRLYRPHDISLIKGLKHLLYEEGYTIKGAQKYLKDHGVAGVVALADGAAVIPASPVEAGPQLTDDAVPAETALPSQAHQPVDIRDDEDWPSDIASDRPAGLAPDQRAMAQSALERVRAARARLEQVLGAAG
ncbi:MAG: MerR family transcriptional regulator [Oceanicaulis sp.]